MSENIRYKFICTFFDVEKESEWHLGSNIVNYLLANRGKVERASVDNIDEVWLEVIVPYPRVHLWQLEEISCHYDVQAILVRNRLHQGVMLFECLRLQIFYYEFERFQVACKRDLDSLVITDPFNDRSEMSYSLVGPLFVK